MTGIYQLDLLLGYLGWHALATIIATGYWGVIYHDEYSIGTVIKEFNVHTFVAVTAFYFSPAGLAILVPYFFWGLYRLKESLDRPSNEFDADILDAIKKHEIYEEKQRVETLRKEKAAKETAARQIAEDQRVRAELAKKQEAQKLLSYWDNLDGDIFEREFAGLLRRNGWVAQETKKSGDGGIDIEATDPRGCSVAIECKRWRQENKVGRPAIQKLYGAALNDYDRLVVITTSGFTDDAIQHAHKAGVELWGREILSELINAANNRSRA